MSYYSILLSIIFQLVCVTSTVPWMIYAMLQQANVLARTVLQMINAANALKVSLDIQIVKVNPRTFIFFLCHTIVRSYISNLWPSTPLLLNQLQHNSEVEIFRAVMWLVKKMRWMSKFRFYVRTMVQQRVTRCPRHKRYKTYINMIEAIKCWSNNSFLLKYALLQTLKFVLHPSKYFITLYKSVKCTC